MTEYNKTTIISGEKITLTEEQTAGIEAFHKSRVAFALLKNGMLSVNEKNSREHRIYLKEDFGITDEEFETLPRGYIKAGKIVIYKSSKFEPLSNEELTDALINRLVSLASTNFGHGSYEIWNGVIIGKPGTEWNGKEFIGTWDIQNAK